jgi:hypothetical protein
MAIVSFVLGDCAKCGGKQTFGVVDVFATVVYRGCKRCPHNERVRLPVVKKRVLYLDQFFFSHAFREGDVRFIRAAERISRLTRLQLVAVPYSSIHEDETHQWKGREDLFKFIKATSCGQKFVSAYDVDETQIIRAFRSWLDGRPTKFELCQDDAIEERVHIWNSYYRISVGKYYGDMDLIRDLKQKSIAGLVDLFETWRRSTLTFEQDVIAEYAASGASYMDFFFAFLKRVAQGDFDAFLDSPVASMVVQHMTHILGEEMPLDERIAKCAAFLASEHFKETPNHWISARVFAELKALVKNGAYPDRERAMKRLSGFFFDVKHIATYAPYVDAFVMDQPMAELVSKPTVGIEQRYGTRVFSLGNWDDLFRWLDEVEKLGMTEEHKAGLRAAYPALLI